jgi:putative membrane protein insertion efficiency factor
VKIISNILIGIIKIYKMVVSPYLTPSCRYLPTCSEYAIDCLKTYGLIQGITKSTKRILSCHPIKALGGGEGFDPVNKKLKIKNNG